MSLKGKQKRKKQVDIASYSIPSKHEENKRRDYSKHWKIENLDANTHFVAFGIDTNGCLGIEARKNFYHNVKIRRI